MTDPLSNDLINFNEILFVSKSNMYDSTNQRNSYHKEVTFQPTQEEESPVPSQPTYSARERSPRTSHTNRSRVMPLSPKYQNSPLLHPNLMVHSPNLGISRPNIKSSKSVRTSKSVKSRNIIESTNRDGFAPPIVNPYKYPQPITSSRGRAASPSTRKSSEPYLYPQREKLFQSSRKEFFDGLSQKYATKAAMTPYGMDMTVYRNEALKRSKQNRQEEAEEYEFESREESRLKTQARLHEVANDKRFHKDYIFNKNYPALRMIPVKDRVDRAPDDGTVFI